VGYFVRTIADTFLSTTRNVATGDAQNSTFDRFSYRTRIRLLAPSGREQNIRIHVSECYLHIRRMEPLHAPACQLCTSFSSCPLALPVRLDVPALRIFCQQCRRVAEAHPKQQMIMAICRLRQDERRIAIRASNRSSQPISALGCTEWRHRSVGRRARNEATRYRDPRSRPVCP
jgi:hypothetical protein